MILDPHGTLIGNDPKGFTDESIALIRETVKQAENRKAIEASLASGSSSKDKNHKDHSESANYLRNAEMSEEQNYSLEHDLNERTR